MKELINKKINRIFMNENNLKFETDGGVLIYTVYGDCCSYSYFHDFIGVKNLLKGGKVKNVEEIEVGDDGKRKGGEDQLSFYGYRITVDDPKLGELSSVVSFRNDSNGYYGGSLNDVSEIDNEVSPEIFDDNWI